MQLVRQDLLAEAARKRGDGVKGEGTANQRGHGDSEEEGDGEEVTRVWPVIKIQPSS